MRMRFVSLVMALALISFPLALQAQDQCTAVYGSGANQFSLATGSPGELGVLKAWADAFTAQTGTSLCWKKAGSGESLKLLKAKTTDISMSHSAAAEKQAVAEGWATQRTLIGSNEFFLVGPVDDPARVAEATSALPTQEPNSFPVVTIRGPTKRRWRSGNQRLWCRQETGMWLPRPS